jgi:hypothetical protein
MNDNHLIEARKSSYTIGRQLLRFCFSMSITGEINMIYHTYF